LQVGNQCIGNLLSVPVILTIDEERRRLGARALGGDLQEPLADDVLKDR
jgi:hypothetical protein